MEVSPLLSLVVDSYGLGEECVIDGDVLFIARHVLVLLLNVRDRIPCSRRYVWS